MPENEDLLLPEPFSEKNIDGSPISRADEGRSLFRNSARKDRRVAERRGTDRRSGGERREPDDYGYVTEAPEPQYQAPPVYEAPRPEPSLYEAPPVPERGRYEEPVSTEYGASETRASSDFGAFEEGPAPERTYDTDRFEPPVDEKPGMIPNPMKMPPVKKKSSLEYDVDSDYGGYGDENESVPDETDRAAESDDGYGYDFGDDNVSSTSGSGGYGYDFDDDRTEDRVPAVEEDSSDYGYGGESSNAPDDDEDFGGNTESGDDEGIGSGTESGDDEGFGSGTDSGDDEDFGSGSGSGGYGDYGSGGYDSNYGSDYDSGSDLSSDYY